MFIKVLFCSFPTSNVIYNWLSLLGRCGYFFEEFFSKNSYQEFTVDLIIKVGENSGFYDGIMVVLTKVDFKVNLKSRISNYSFLSD